MQSNGQLTFSLLSAGEVAAALDDLARLRISVFAAWPYLYAGDAAYEARYLAQFAASEGAVVIAARDPAGRMVGAATAAPLADHASEFAIPFARAGLDPADYFYLAESVLEPAWRGQGAGKRFSKCAKLRAGRRALGAPCSPPWFGRMITRRGRPIMSRLMASGGGAATGRSKVWWRNSDGPTLARWRKPPSRCRSGGGNCERGF
ncbi:hypothetical protein [Hoeflea algicola]|uniref:hypothetical protein n=1 Tax=Hoeflea algicola TaxID=2983763 RepID=UPI002D1E3CE7|nr:hypothetical protein [Hoeflea algicola]